jgi:hypothetical protein
VITFDEPFIFEPLIDQIERGRDFFFDVITVDDARDARQHVANLFGQLSPIGVTIFLVFDTASLIPLQN